jgi:hypothetical protein
MHEEEHFRAGGHRADFVDVTGKSLTDGTQERIDLGLSSLQTKEPEGSPRPSDSNFAAPDAI